MTRAERRWHLWAWRVLAPLIVAGLYAALTSRPPAPVNDAATPDWRASATEGGR